MDSEKISKSIKAARNSCKEPILAVKYKIHLKGKGHRIRKVCGFFHTWNDFDGALWLWNKNPRKKKGARMPIMIQGGDILSIKWISILNLIDNSNILYDLIEENKDIAKSVA
jgi:hypothetical protein